MKKLREVREIIQELKCLPYLQLTQIQFLALHIVSQSIDPEVAADHCCMWTHTQIKSEGSLLLIFFKPVKNFALISTQLGFFLQISCDWALFLYLWGQGWLSGLLWFMEISRFDIKFPEVFSREAYPLVVPKILRLPYKPEDAFGRSDFTLPATSTNPLFTKYLSKATEIIWPQMDEQYQASHIRIAGNNPWLWFHISVLKWFIMLQKPIGMYPSASCNLYAYMHNASTDASNIPVFFLLYFM